MSPSVLIILSFIFGITIGYRNYIKANFKLNWYAASDYCMDNYGTELATISNVNESDTAKSVCFDVNPDSFGCWIGFNDLAYEGQWKWKSNVPVTYTNWLTTPWIQPDNGPHNNEHCGHIWNKDGWNDHTCNDVFQFLCDSPTNSPTKSPAKLPTKSPSINPSTLGIDVSNSESNKIYVTLESLLIIISSIVVIFICIIILLMCKYSKKNDNNDAKISDLQDNIESEAIKPNAPVNEPLLS